MRCRTRHEYDNVELQSRYDKKPFSSPEDEYEIPSLDTNPMAGKADFVKLQENSVYEVINDNRP